MKSRALAAAASLAPDSIHTNDLARDQIRSILTNAPGTLAAIGGIQIVTDNGWFAARPSGT